MPTTKRHTELKIPQARILAVLANGIPPPALTRPKLAVRAGFSPISGSVTRVLNGIREGSSSGAAHPGLIELGLIATEVIDVDGVEEQVYSITDAGRAALACWLDFNDLPKMRDSVASTNKRYQGEADAQG